MFKSISAKININDMELAILKMWQEKKIFQQLTKAREGGPEYVFFEGPPTANGKPGVHHALARAFKDLFPRYKLMNGFNVERRGGWDTHGLPVEIEVEKKLGFTNKAQIEEYGIDKFNAHCRDSATEYIRDWEKFTARLGFWVDFDSAYITYKNEYIESVWNILKTYWDSDLLYQGYKVVPYCPRCGTPLSDHEVAQGYKDVDDPSIFVRFPLVDQPGTSLLVWTTTPWTLPGNVAVAAHADEDYVKVLYDHPDNGEEKLILAKALVGKVFGDQEVEILETFKGKKLDGWKYQPLYKFLPFEKEAHYVILMDYVTMEDGTGLVHTAPAFGGEDMDASAKYDLPVLQTVKEDGTFIQEVRPWSGVFVKDADPEIIRELTERGLMFKITNYTHTYPFCWRCDSPLIYYARGTWFIRTSKYKDRLVSLNQEINWVPNHNKDGRFGNWLENNIDWSLGRERYWGTPLPVWECEDCEHQVCVGSIKELSELAGYDLSESDLHRPYVDSILLNCPECKTSKSMKRVPELIDVWFDSGAMPFAQWHYPFENVDSFESQFPADFICEAVDQTRGWFYSLHAISTLYKDSVAFKNVICLGHVLDEEGSKMSKSKGNVIDPWDIFNGQGADAFRWYLYTVGPPGNSRRFSANLVEEVVKNFTLTLWNVYSFFTTYSNLDNWKPDPSITPEYNELDKWLLSSLYALVRDVTTAFEEYDVPGTTRPIEGFVDSLSNWYLRRSRRRFWKSESDSDKYAAYATLYEVLTTLSSLLAPSMPFLAEELYQNLVLSVDENAPESIHLTNWPEIKAELVDDDLNAEMQLVMKLASIGHAARNKAAIKVRQPLSRVAFSTGSASESRVIKKYEAVLSNELNVKEIAVLGSAGEAVTYALNPLPRQLGSRFQDKFPKVRKAILELDANLSAAKLLAEESVFIRVDGEEFEIMPDEVEVRADAKSGLTVAQDSAYLAALSTELTDELISEGYAREFIRRVQDLRKEAGFEISDRIEVYFEAGDTLTRAVNSNADYIKGEVLAVMLDGTKMPDEVSTPEEELMIDGEVLKLGLKKVLL